MDCGGDDGGGNGRACRGCGGCGGRITVNVCPPHGAGCQSLWHDHREETSHRHRVRNSLPHEWTMSLSENTAEWVAFFGFAALAIFVICWAICKDLKKIDEETERKIKGLPPKRRKRRRDEDVESGGDDGFDGGGGDGGACGGCGGCGG